jgi:hypothetical protein
MRIEYWWENQKERELWQAKNEVTHTYIETAPFKFHKIGIQ